MYGNTTDPGDHAPKVLVVRVEFRGEDQHGMIERELGFRGGNLSQGLDALRDGVIRLLGVRPPRAGEQNQS
jgi:hypothetical protein